MKTIKITTNCPGWPLERQTPGSSSYWGNYNFYINKKIKKCDYWIVFGGLKKPETTICPKENIIFIDGEPESVKKNSLKFLKQFNLIITSQKNTGHHNVINKQQGLPWMVGCEYDKKNECWKKEVKNYDYFKRNNFTEKTKTISVISSNKKNTKGHRSRLNFLETLSNNFGNDIDIFGRGIKDFDDKLKVIAPYKYHIALENSSHKDYWTEKLSDTFLADTYPIYYGCSNIYDYFPEGSMSVIDIEDPKNAIKKIKEIINNNTYEKSLEKIKEAKDLVLNEYNLFPMIINIIENKMKEDLNKYKKIKLKPESSYIKKNLKRILPKILIKKLKYIIDVVNWTIKKRINPPHIIKQMTVKKYTKKYQNKILIETGTYRGEMVDAMKNKFKKIYSIELSEKLSEEAQERFKKYQNINIINGDSGEVMPELMKKIDEPCVFWLDGHYSAGFTAKGDLNTPIIKELDAIFKHRIKKHIILIDDARCFVGKDDYPTMDKIKEMAKENNLSVKIKNDIIIIV